MAEPTAAEVIPKTIVKENAPSTPTTQAEKTAQEVTQKADEGLWREGLEFAKRTPISQSKIDAKIEQIGGVEEERDDQGRKQRSQEELNRLNKAKDAAELAKNFIENGYDKLDDAAKEQLRGRVLTELESRPSIAAEMKGLSKAQQKALAERILRDSRYKEYMRQNIEEALNLPNIDEETILSAQAAYEDAEIDHESKESDLKITNNRLESVVAELDEVDTELDEIRKAPESTNQTDQQGEGQASPRTIDPEINQYQQEIEENQAKVKRLERERQEALQKQHVRPLGVIEGELNEAQGNEQEAQQIINNSETSEEDKNNAKNTLARERRRREELEKEKRRSEQLGAPRRIEDINKELDQAEEKVSKARQNLADAQSRKQEATDTQTQQKEEEKERKQEEKEETKETKEKESELEKRRRELEKRHEELQEEQTKKEAELKKAKNELKRRQRNLEDTKALRKSQEQDIADGFENTFETSVDDWTNEWIQQAEQELNKVLEEQKQQAKDDTEKVMYDALRERWLGKKVIKKEKNLGGRWGIPRIATIRSEYSYRPIDRDKTNKDFQTLIQGGPDQLAKDILSKRTNPTTGNQYTAEEIGELIKDKEFMGKMQPEMTRQLLTRKHLTGGFTQEDIFTLEQTPWGKGMVEQAIDNADQHKELIEKAFGSGALNRHGFKERFGQIARANPLWMMILLGIPLAAIGAATMEATRETIQQQ